MANLSTTIATFCTIAFLAPATLAAQEACSEFEAQVFTLVDQAGHFQKSDRFAEYGWSKAGPTNGWLTRFQELRDATSRETNLEFFRTYDFFLTDAYQVANAYRTDGQLDAFYQESEDRMLNANRCQY